MPSTSLLQLSTTRIAPFAVVDVCAWFDHRVPLVLDHESIPLLDRWHAELEGLAPISIPGRVAEGPGRSREEATSLIAFLREHARVGEPFTFNALHLEPQGGRWYPCFIDGYSGPITISARQYCAAQARFLLSAMRRDVRALVRAPEGWSLLELDFRSCHSAIGHFLSGDAQLGADVADDAHALIGDMVAPGLEASRRRELGKAINVSMLFGATPHRIAELAREFLGREPADRTGRALWMAWWSRYPALAEFRDRVGAYVLVAQADHTALELVSPSGRRSCFSPAELLGRVTKGGRKHAPEEMWRTVFAAAFRSIEGDLMHGVCKHFFARESGGQIALPIYDGGIFASPSGEEAAVRVALLDAAKMAAGEIGLKVEATIKARTR